MPQVVIFNNQQQFYGVNPTFSGMTLLNSGRNLKTWWNFEDFCSGATTNLKYGIWNPFANGAGARAIDIAGAADRPGIVMLSASGVGEWACLSGVYTNASTYLFGAGEYTFEGDFMLGALSTAVEEFQIHIGYSDNAWGLSVDGVGFLYDRTVSVNWQGRNSNNGVVSLLDTGIAVVAGAWTRLKIIVNAAGTLSSFYINDVLVGTLNANIPIVAGREFSHMVNMLKTVGATERWMICDWIWLHIDLAVSR